jgi:hypothetical protein
MAEFPPPPEDIVLAHFTVSADVERSARFYTDGHLIEVGQATDTQGDWSPAHWPSGASGA